MRKRSNYRPKPVNRQAHLLAMLGVANVTQDDALLKSQAVSLAVEDVVRGKANREEWSTVFDAINLCEELCRMGLADGLDAVLAIQQSVVHVWDRLRDTGSRTLYASEIADLRDMAAAYAGLVSGLTNKQLSDAEQRIENRVRRVLASKPKDTTVVVLEAA